MIAAILRTENNKRNRAISAWSTVICVFIIGVLGYGFLMSIPSSIRGVILISLGIIAIALPVWNYYNETTTNRLSNLLASKKWKQANEETERLLRLISAQFVDKRLALQSINELDQFCRIIGLRFISRFLIYKWTATYKIALQPEDIKKFPCSSLKAIDQLWTQYSGGYFGFSVQSRIYEECKTKDSPNTKKIEAYKKLYNDDFSVQLLMAYDQLGWSFMESISKEPLPPKYCFLFHDMESINYSLTAPKGGLPVLGHHSNMSDPYMSEWWQRLKNCGR